MSSTEPFRDCPRFERCSVNHFPLDPLAGARESLPDDPEPRCTLPKRRRMEIAARYPDALPERGLRPRELSTLRQWETLAPEERERWKAARVAWARAVNASRAKAAGKD